MTYPHLYCLGSMRRLSHRRSRVQETYRRRIGDQEFIWTFPENPKTPDLLSSCKVSPGLLISCDHCRKWKPRRHKSHPYVTKRLPNPHSFLRGRQVRSRSMDDEFDRLHAYWRACNYLAVGMIYLRDNPLLREPLTTQHIKHRLLG